jgi:hypothetical protein
MAISISREGHRRAGIGSHGSGAGGSGREVTGYRSEPGGEVTATVTDTTPSRPPIGPGTIAKRIESDAMGQAEVPADYYWGARMQHSPIHCSIGRDHMPKPVSDAYRYVKKAGAIVQADAGRVEEELADAILPDQTPRDARLASFTGQVRIAILDAESRARLTHLAEEQAALRRVATLVARGTPQEEVFAAVVEEIVQLLGVDSAIMGRYGSDGTLTSVARSGGPREHLPVGSRRKLGAGYLRGSRPSGIVGSPVGGPTRWRHGPPRGGGVDRRASIATRTGENRQAALVSKPLERLADRGASDSELLSHVLLAHERTRCEFAADYFLAEADV